jgi:hypothetical protein
MELVFSFGSRPYLTCLLVLLLTRAADFLSTWIASPTLALEGNPISKKLGWLRAGVVNVIAAFVLAHWLVPAVIVSTMSVLLAARNFQFAWLMRTTGEEGYRAWMLERLAETPPGLFLFSLFGQTLLTAALGVAVVMFSRLEDLIVVAMGVGIVGYALAVAFYTLNALWRNRRALG